MKTLYYMGENDFLTYNFSFYFTFILKLTLCILLLGGIHDDYNGPRCTVLDIHYKVIHKAKLDWNIAWEII